MFVMPKPHPREFREDVVAVARKGDAPIAQIAKESRSRACATGCTVPMSRMATGLA